ncbi:unnamed protein product, partial [Onchocerca flexuosa]|uniref:TACC_C domain-containing protein n=1 Tax=Onchocerca flexuosa TaxID=387005 RepID=A0A183HSE0_9BILA
DSDGTTTRRLSNIPAQIANLPPYTDVPPPKPPRPFLEIFSNLKKKKDDEETEVVPSQATPDSGVNQQEQQQSQTLPVKKPSNMEMTRSSSIVRSISDYHTSEVPRIVVKSHTTIFDEKSPSFCKGMTELDNALSFTDDKSLSDAMNDALSANKAPLALLQEICSGNSADLENISHSDYEVKNFSKSFKTLR